MRIAGTAHNAYYLVDFRREEKTFQRISLSRFTQWCHT